VRFQRRAAAIGLIAAGALLFSACGSDDNSGGGSTPQASGVTCGGKQALKASGSTAQANAITGFVNTFEQTCSGQTVDYTASGSGAGRNDFIGGQTDFAGSDAAPKPDETAKAQQRCASTPLNLPMVFGPIAIAYNVAGVTDLALDGATLAKIFNGTVKTWNDPAIAALDPGKNLPAAPIVVNFRSDESGTTQNFQTYLNAASDNAYGKPSTQTFNGGTGAGAKGSQGVTDATKNTPDSIAYIEASFAQKAQLPTASIVNAGGGPAVPLSTDAVAKAVDTVKVTGQGNDLTLDLSSLYKTVAPGAYPIALATYEVVCTTYADPQTGQAVKAFLQTALSPQGQGTLTQGGYVPVPDAFKARLTTSVNAIS
jgi:phosphate transport system substrate-binding protein